MEKSDAWSRKLLSGWPSRFTSEESLRELESSEQPLMHPRVRPLTGKLKGDYRVRIGSWRVLLTPDREDTVLYVYAILPRGGAY